MARNGPKLTIKNPESQPKLCISYSPLGVYSQLSAMVRMFVVAVKLWAKAEGLIGAPRGRLSSYAFVLVALYFLQVDAELRLHSARGLRNAKDSMRPSEFLIVDDVRVSVFLIYPS